MASEYDVSNWYWSVTDTSPSTQVFSSAVGDYVVLADATYTSWLALGNSPTVIDTQANLYIVINSAALDNLNKLWGFESLAAAPDVVLTNPLPTLSLVLCSLAGAHEVALPQANMPNGMPIGEPFYIRNSSLSVATFDLYDFTGTNLLYSALAIGDELRVIKKTNASIDGTYDIVPSPRLPVRVPNGGTGTNTLTDHGILLGSGTDAVTPTAVMTDGQLLVGQTGADPLPKTISGVITIDQNGVTSLSTSLDAMLFKGVIDCSANPNYPAADAGNVYRVSVAGKIGGASGPNVEIGDALLCLTDGTASGNHATVGANWNITQSNIDGAVIGPASATNNGFAKFDGTTGKLIKDSAATISLTSEVTGDLPFANLTQGSARSVLAVAGNATADFASIQGTASQFLGINAAGTALAFQTMSGDVTLSGGAATIKTDVALAGNPTTTTQAVDDSTTRVATTAFVLAQAASATPIVNGTGAVGTSTRYARGDHVHPTDTSRAPTASPTFTGTITASGGQIAFPATQSASSDANTLDDYEEGTWTPIDSSGAALSLTAAVGTYTKIGREVTVRGSFTYPVNASGANTLIGGLPFTVANQEDARDGVIVAHNGATAKFWVVDKNATTSAFYSSSLANVTNAQMSGSLTYISATYMV